MSLKLHKVALEFKDSCVYWNTVNRSKQATIRAKDSDTKKLATTSYTLSPFSIKDT